MTDRRPFRPGRVALAPDAATLAAQHRRAVLLAAVAYVTELRDRPTWANAAADRAIRALMRALNAPPHAPPVPLPATIPADTATDAERATFAAAVLSGACADDPDARPLLPHLAAIAGRRHFDPPRNHMTDNTPAQLRAGADPRAASKAAAEARRRGAACECRACGLQFATVAAFDAHRAGSYSHDAPAHGRRCLSPEAAGLHAAAPLPGETAARWAIRARSFSPQHLGA